MFLKMHSLQWSPVYQSVKVLPAVEINTVPRFPHPLVQQMLTVRCIDIVILKQI